MNKLQKLLCIGTGALILGLTGCSKEIITYETGTVIEEKMIEEKKEFGVFSKKVDTDKTYTLKIKTENGIYVAEIFDYSGTTISVESLDFAINKGSKVKFKIREKGFGYDRGFFGDNKTGRISVNDLEILTD